MDTAQVIPLLLVALIVGAVAGWWFAGRGSSGSTPSLSGSGRTAAPEVPTGRRDLLQAATDEVAEENRELREKVSALNGKLKKIDGRQEKADAQVAEAEARTAKAQERMAAAQAERDRLREELDATKGELRQAQVAEATRTEGDTDVEALQAEVAAAKKAQDTAEGRAASAQQKVDQANRATRDAERARDEARKLFDQANRERSTYRAEVDELRTRLGLDPLDGPPAEDATPDPTPEPEPEPQPEPEPEATAPAPEPEPEPEPEPGERAPGELAEATEVPPGPTEPEPEPEPEPEFTADGTPKAAKVAPPEQEVAAPTPSAAPSDPSPAGKKEKDDLTRIEGVGPKIAVVLARSGIASFRALSMASQEAIDAALEAGDVRFAPSKETWRDQAGLLAEGRVDEFEAMKADLVAGRADD